MKSTCYTARARTGASMREKGGVPPACGKRDELRDSREDEFIRTRPRYSKVVALCCGTIFERKIGGADVRKSAEEKKKRQEHQACLHDSAVNCAGIVSTKNEEARRRDGGGATKREGGRRSRRLPKRERRYCAL